MSCKMETSTATSSNYIPRSALDHMSPFFFKSHQHAHTHSHPHHHHHHSHRHHLHQPYEHIPSHTTSTSSNTGENTLPTPARSPLPAQSSPSSSIHVPTPRRCSTQIDADSSYTTPPATPPLTGDVAKASTTPIISAPSAVDTRPAVSTVVDEDPVAWCTARARIPTPDGSEYFLHIYENRKDRKEHLAFVFGDAIRSTSLDRVRLGETELDRIKRGAYTGRIRPVPAAQAATKVEDGWISASEASEAALTSVTTTATTAATAAEDVTMTDASPFTSSATVAPKAPLVRIHSECFTGEIGHSARCDCGEQLDEAIRLMKAEGSGVVVYLRQEGRGIGLGEKLKAYNLQDLGYDTVMANLLLNHGADERTYDVAQAILEDLGLQEIRLLTNNPDKIEKVTANSSIRVVERVPMMPKSWEAIIEGREELLEVKEGAVENKIVRGKELNAYLVTKVSRMRHMIDIPGTFQ